MTFCAFCCISVLVYRNSVFVSVSLFLCIIIIIITKYFFGGGLRVLFGCFFFVLLFEFLLLSFCFVR